MSSVIGKLGLAVQRSVWTKRADTWDHAENPGLGRVIEAVLAKAGALPSSEALDLGCGSGQLSLPLSQKVKSVLATAQNIIDQRKTSVSVITNSKHLRPTCIAHDWLTRYFANIRER